MSPRIHKGPCGSRGRLSLWAGLAALAVLAGAALLGPGRADAGAGSRLTLSALEQTTIVQINALRVSKGLAPLTVSRLLYDSASFHNQDMLAGGFFGHQSTDGEDFGQRLELYYPPHRFSYYAVGENLFWAPAAIVDSTAILSRWMGSSEHRKNLLGPSWRQIGISAVTVPSADGIFGGAGEITIVTVDFGVRR
jgi:uncharacterized protein YkwD